MHSVQPAPFITQILESAGTDFIEPVEILKFLQKNIALGRNLEVTSLDCVVEGETNFSTIDRENILQTTLMELKYVTNPRFTLQVDFMRVKSFDLGGPRKECIRLVNQAVKANYFDTGLRSLMSNDHFFVGQMLGIALLQNGQIPSFLSEATLQKLISENTTNKCIFEMQKGLETLGMYSALKNFYIYCTFYGQMVNIIR